MFLSKTNIWMAALCPLFIACAHTETADLHEASLREIASEPRIHPGDPSLKQGELTIWTLQRMAQRKEFAALDRLFNHGVTLDRLPIGYSAGVGARVFDSASVNYAAIDAVTGLNWRGQIFFTSLSGEISRGLNRIKQDQSPVAAKDPFHARLISSHELAPQATSNLVILSYAHPKPKSVQPEAPDREIQVYDVMVAVPGKYGPIYVGKSWPGTYNDQGEFKASAANAAAAWYFLDFNPAALREQKKRHWDGAQEKRIDYTR